MSTSTTMQQGISLADAQRLTAAAQGVLDRALAHAKAVTNGGKAIDEHQVHAERIAYAATE
ncbi:MAG: hypothetical protein ACREDI_13960, partial [Roseiarcus sp.]